MSPLRGVTLAGLAKKYPKNGGVRKANSLIRFRLTFLQRKFTCGDGPRCTLHQVLRLSNCILYSLHIILSRALIYIYKCKWTNVVKTNLCTNVENTKQAVTEIRPTLALNTSTDFVLRAGIEASCKRPTFILRFCDYNNVASYNSLFIEAIFQRDICKLGRKQKKLCP